MVSRNNPVTVTLGTNECTQSVASSLRSMYVQLSSSQVHPRPDSVRTHKDTATIVPVLPYSPCENTFHNYHRHKRKHDHRHRRPRPVTVHGSTTGDTHVNVVTVTVTLPRPSDRNHKRNATVSVVSDLWMDVQSPPTTSPYTSVSVITIPSDPYVYM